MYQAIIALEQENSLRKKPRLSISQMAFLPQKLKIAKQKLKPEMKRKFSEINLKDVLLAGLNHQNPNAQAIIEANIDPQQQNKAKNVKKYRSYTNHLHEQLGQNFIVNQNQNQKNINTERTKNKNTQKSKIDSFLPSLYKYASQQSKTSHIGLTSIDEKNKPEQQKAFFSLHMQNAIENKKKQSFQTFKKLRSQSLIHLQNKLKLNKVKSSNNKDASEQQNSKQRQIDLPRSNTQKVKPTFTKQTSPEAKQKKFYINNINLQSAQNHGEGLKKRSYIIKFLEKNQKQLFGKPQNRKNSYFTTTDKQKQGIKLSPKKFSYDENLVSKKIVFAHPNQISLKKIEEVVKKQAKNKKIVKCEEQIEVKIPIQFKIKKQCINGWDFQKQFDQQILEVDESHFQAIY